MDPVVDQEINVAGLHQKGVPLPDGSEEPHPTKMVQIISWIEDPESTDLEAINRLVAMEIALTLTDKTLVWNHQAVTSRVKALQALSKTLQDGDSLAKKDFLNFDGPKFKYVLQELVVLFRTSLKSSGLSDDVINHVLRIFRDGLELRETDLRRETEHVTSESLFLSVSSPEPSVSQGT